MADGFAAAREGDALLHSSMLADVLGGVLEVAAMVAVTALATAAVVAATGITVATGGLGCLVLGAVVGVVVGLGMSKTGADTGLSRLCEGIAGALFPPVVDAFISSGSPDVWINGKPAARAAGRLSAVSVASGEAPSYLDIAGNFFSQLWRPTVATPVSGAEPCAEDTVACAKHPPMPEQFLAEGSSRVFINGQPAVRSGDRSTCEAKVGTVEGLISPNVFIGGAPVVVREIRSGKTPGVGLAVSTLLMLRGGPAKFVSNLPCMLAGGAVAYGAGQVATALGAAVSGSPNPVHAATGAKVLGGEEELDFRVPGLLALEWQRFYNSRDRRMSGMFGCGWSVAYEVSVEIGQEGLVYVDEQARRIDLGHIPVSSAAFSPGEGLAVRRSVEGLLVESIDGIYRLFEVDPLDPSSMRLVQLGDRNEARIFLDYDEQGRIVRLRESHNLLQLELGYCGEHPRRVSEVARRYLRDQFFEGQRDVLASYGYDAAGQLDSVIDATGHVKRRFAYDADGRMIEHQLSTGLCCFYQWTAFDGEPRVSRHWTDNGEEYTFVYEAGVTRITDGLHRTSVRQWNAQFQITHYTDALGHLWQFEWNDERQLLAAVDPQEGRWRFSHDHSGNLASSTDPLGQTHSTLWLEHWSLPQVETDAAGNSWHYRYDSHGNCTEIIDPLGHGTRYVHDGFGQVVQIIDAHDKRKVQHWNEWSQLSEYRDCSDYSTAYGYDAFGHLQRLTDPTGEVFDYQHDALGRLLQSRLPDGRVERYERDASGQLLARIDPAGNATRYLRDRLGRVRQRQDALKRNVAFAYDPYGRLQALSNENDEAYRFTWDAADRLVRQLDIDQSARRYAYDGLSNVVRVEHLPATAQAPLIHQLQRDPLGRLLRKVTADGQTDYRYNTNDQPIAITFSDGDGRQQHLGFAYDALGQLLQESGASGVLTHTYDELGNAFQTQLPDGRQLNRLFYGSGHLHQLNLDGEVLCDIERDRLHREILRTQGQLTSHFDYDRSGRLRGRKTRLGSQPRQLPARFHQEFSYDPGDNLIGIRGNQRDQHLHYDATGRIMASEGPDETFAYDRAANLLDRPDAGFVRHNQLLTYQDNRYGYDGFGRMCEKHSRRHGWQRFCYDAEHRLSEVHNADGHIVRMTYDPLGRRIEKSEYNLSGILLGQSRFTWDGLRLLQEHRNTQASLYLYIDDSHEPLARVDGLGAHQAVRYYHNDPNGLPQHLTEADGQVVWQCRYRVWGATLKERREAYYIEEQNLRFQGQYLDRETGLHYNTFRFYDPAVGRFTTPDPIGLVGGVNFYQYAPNSFAYADPLGLNPKCRLTGVQHQKATELPIIKSGTKDWWVAIRAIRQGGRGDVRVIDSITAKKLLVDARGNMDARKMYSYKLSKYEKGYEMHKPQHGSRPGGWENGEVRVGNDLPHVKWKDGSGSVGHIFFED